MKTKALTILLLLGLVMNFSGFGVLAETLAYYNDTETSSDNAHTAGSLDFVLTKTSYEDSIGLAETVSFNSILLNSGTLDWRYTVKAEKISGNGNFCGALDLETKLNGSEKHDGSLLTLDVPASSTLGTWKFDITLPVEAAGVSHGDTCKVDFVFKGWQSEIGSYEESGFSDEERISVELTAYMIVLNEFLPRPDGVAYGFDFGNDSSDMPQGEWVELYNNSDSSFNLTGWYIWDASGVEANKIAVTAANTDLATTVIPAGGWLVVYMNKAVLNNTGDTVKLFDESDALIDSHAYVGNDFCEIEPTPGDDNSTTVSGDCEGVPPNKSYARIPDGIGGWVDPIPTPGGVNRLNEAEEVIVTQDTDSSQASVPADENTSQISDQLSDFITDVLEFLDGGNEEVIAPVSEEEIIITPEETEETVVTEEVLPTEENNEASADTSEPVVGAVMPEEENVTEPEVVEAPAPEPEVVAEEPPQPAEEIVEPLPQVEPTPEATI